jgi:hypothetical protein
MKAADEIFQSRSYVSMVQALQQEDKANSFANSTMPEWFQPSSQTGIHYIHMYIHKFSS